MPSNKLAGSVLFQEAVDRARAIAHEVPKLGFHEAKESPAYSVDLVRFEGKHLSQAYGKRFIYRDQKGRWNAIDALVSGERLTGIAVHTPAAAAQWVATLRNTRRRRNPEADFTKPAFVMTPGYNLHFISFPKPTSRKPVHHLHLHDGLRPKARARLIGPAELEEFHEQLNDRFADILESQR
jgi:hypothetical protein